MASTKSLGPTEMSPVKGGLSAPISTDSAMPVARERYGDPARDPLIAVNHRDGWRFLALKQRLGSTASRSKLSTN